MPTKIPDLTALTNYTVPALKRALHHAPNITEIVPTVISCVVLYADPCSLMGRGNGSTTAGNMGWITSLATGRQ
jgi:hypothetical protein